VLTRLSDAMSVVTAHLPAHAPTPKSTVTRLLPPLCSLVSGAGISPSACLTMAPQQPTRSTTDRLNRPALQARGTGLRDDGVAA
jgi:hypothetical protein